MLPKKSMKRRMRERRQVLKARMLKRAKLPVGCGARRSVQEVREFCRARQGWEKG